MHPVVFNREELQYGAYEMRVGDYCWGDDGGEVSECDEVFRGVGAIKEQSMVDGTCGGVSAHGISCGTNSS